MCYFCHKLGRNPQAPAHRTKRCLNKANNLLEVNNKPDDHEDQRVDKSSPCSICLDAPANMAFIPCGHVATCDTCDSLVQECPMCRQAITGRQKLFFS